MPIGIQTERISYARPAELPGVEIIRADHTTQCLRIFHQNYMVNTNLIHGDPDKYGKTLYRGKILTTYDGQTLLGEPGEVQNVKYISSPVAFRALFITPETLEKKSKEMGISGTQPHFQLSLTDNPLLFEAFKHLHRSLESKCASLERQCRWTYCLRVLFEIATEKAPASLPKGLARQAIKRAVELLHENVSEDISLENLAAAARLSPFHFLREFTRVTGLPPHAYQIQLRLGRARQLLRMGMSPSQAATDSGFADQSHLIRHFKRNLGVTPAQYAGLRN
jgi:AraC-like DNA-binding protein